MESPQSDETMQDDVSTARSPLRWRYPYFESIVATIVEHVTRDRSSIDPGKNATVNILEEGFLPEDRSWIDDVRDDRMSYDSEVLYRPEIVNALVTRIAAILASRRKRGLMVKGPQGVGKSHSLINLTRNLMARNDYWVTIIPNCEEWTEEIYFFRTLLKSVGVEPGPVHLQVPSGPEQMMDLINDIDTVLYQHGMRWVFIFDQINKIFARQQFHLTRNVGLLPFPFVLMKKVLKRGRIISVLSASANNDASHRENHEGFDEFEHPTQFHLREINLLYTPERVLGWSLKEVEYATGLVPLYLNWWVNDRDNYSSNVKKDVETSLVSLRREQIDIWSKFVDAAVLCLLLLPVYDEPVYLDRKFLRIQKSLDKPYRYSVVALFPLVEYEYRRFFWDGLFTYIREREHNVLVFCRDEKTTKDTLGRCFEELVIARLVTDGVSTDDFRTILANTNIEIDEDWEEELRRPAEKIQLAGFAYPEGVYWKNCVTYFIPILSNFPAVDLLIRVRKIVIAVQIHTSHKVHTETHKRLMLNIQKAGWNTQQVEKIILVYLSPNLATKQQMEQEVGKQAEGDWLITRCCSINDFDSLRNLQWDI